MQAATLTAVVVFPTPPFWLAMAYTVAMSGADASGRGGGPGVAAGTRPSVPERPWNGIRRNAPAAFPPCAAGPSRRRQLARVVCGSVGPRATPPRVAYAIGRWTAARRRPTQARTERQRPARASYSAVSSQRALDRHPRTAWEARWRGRDLAEHV